MSQEQLRRRIPPRCGLRCSPSAARRRRRSGDRDDDLDGSGAERRIGRLGRRIGRLMKVEAKKKTNVLVGAMLLFAGVAAAFWMLALSPKRDEASKLDAQVKQLESSL